MNNLVNIRKSIRKNNNELPKFASDASDHVVPTSIYDINVKGKVYNNILETIGNTPLIKLNKVPKDHGLDCQIFVKCEFMNPGGSIKDRIAYGMIKDAEKNGKVTDKTVFVEPTSGNTGIGIALNASVMGHKSVIVTTPKNDGEKVDTMRLMGSDVIIIKANQKEMDVARQITKDDPNGLMLDQFDNIANPKTQYCTTGLEIINSLQQVDVLVLGCGTGGTMTGVAERLKQVNPECLVVVADPVGSVMFNPKEKYHPYLVEGIGGLKPPSVMNKSLVNRVEKVNDKESFLMAREVALKESILCGGSSGCALSAAVKVAKEHALGPDKNVVVILPDGIRNYMDKFVCDQWMEAHLFQDPPNYTMKWWKKPATDIKLTKKYPTINKDISCEKALKYMTYVDIAIVVDDDKNHIGAFSKDTIRKHATNPTKYPHKDCEEFDFQDPVSQHLNKSSFTLLIDGENGVPTVGLVSRILDIAPFVVLGHKNADKFVPNSVITASDIVEYIKDF